MDKISVKINLLGDLEKYQKESHILINYDATLSAMLQYFNIPEKKDLVIIANGKRADKDYILKENDEITIFPPVDGG
ncbi:MAG: MoaD/ThiS family protein [Deltaproteobacteria bacterium]|nr:MoaD/ThiS family protein [Deltaproteobacteria bacterium]